MLVGLYLEQDRPLTDMETKALYLLTGASQKSWREVEEKYRKKGKPPVSGFRRKNV